MVAVGDALVRVDFVTVAVCSRLAGVGVNALGVHDDPDDLLVGGVARRRGLLHQVVHTVGQTLAIVVEQRAAVDGHAVVFLRQVVGGFGFQRPRAGFQPQLAGGGININRLLIIQRECRPGEGVAHLVQTLDQQAVLDIGDVHRGAEVALEVALPVVDPPGLGAVHVIPGLRLGVVEAGGEFYMGQLFFLYSLIR